VHAISSTRVGPGSRPPGPPNRRSNPRARALYSCRHGRGANGVILRGWSLVRPGVNVAVGAVVALGLVLASPSVNYAHDIPASVRVFVFIKPVGQTLRVVIRAPLEAMRDVNFPLNGPGYLDIGRATPLLKDAAHVWLAGDLHLYENDSPLGEAKIVATRISLPSDRSFTSFDGAVAHAT